ncbi:MAG: hypothetical protein E7292_12545 [Lachnospiraceae bacterium]|nr:hypothetical protein [Lachnospiraceae bacterium]
MAEGEKFNWRLTAVWWMILLVGAMYLMLMTATKKTIVIADSSNGKETAGEQYAVRQELLLESVVNEDGAFWIPLEKNTKAGNVVVENSYQDRELRIFIGGAQEQFYENCVVQGAVETIVKADYEIQRSGVLIRLQMDSVYEFQTSMDGEILKIQSNKPQELYSMVVVIDPAECDKISLTENGTEAEEVTLAVCRLLSEQWDMEGVKLYFTRTAERSASDEERKALSDAVEADVYIRLDVAEAEDSSLYGIRGCYNEEYFIPDFGNVELADILTRNVTVAADNRAVGLAVAEDKENVLYKLEIPAASIELGYLSNEKECLLMGQETYRQKLADGVKAAVKEVYSNYYE